VIYFVGGLTKCLGAGWWNGDSMWRALIRPPFDLIPSQTLMEWQPLLLVTGIMVCLLEVGFPILIWPKKTRVICLTAIIGMHVGIGLTMGLYLFSLVMIVLNLAAFAPGLAVWGWRQKMSSAAAI
jgi:fucose 4-O-acetylase-like acetyltransferase